MIKPKIVVAVAGWACLLCCWACMCCGPWAGQTSATAEHAEFNNNNKNNNNNNTNNNNNNNNNNLVNYKPEHKR